MLRLHPPAVVAALALASCHEPGAQPAAPAAAPAPAPPSTPQRSDAACVAPLDLPGAREKLRERKGEVRLGALSGLKDADEDNVAFLKRLVAELSRRGAEVLVADGDLGDNSDEQETLLGVLADAGLPLLVAAGNREVRSDLDAAEADLRRKGARIVDLSHTRVVELGDVTVVGLPGAFERRQLHSEGGCVYAQRDLDALLAALPRLPPPLLLVAAAPPRGQGPQSLDVSDGQNLGDARLDALLPRVQFGIFGQVWESGGRAVDGNDRPVPQGAWTSRLYLNPGAADHTPWPMADGSTVAGQAALLDVRGGQASWESVRLSGDQR